MGRNYERERWNFMNTIVTKLFILTLQLIIQISILFWQRKTHSSSPYPVVLIVITGILMVIAIWSV
jgi:hypothetical protein